MFCVVIIAEKKLTYQLTRNIYILAVLLAVPFVQKKKKIRPRRGLEHLFFLCKTYTRTRSIQKMEPYKISPGPLTLYSRTFLNLSVTSHVRIQKFFPMGGGVPKDNFAFRGEVAPMPISGTF